MPPHRAQKAETVRAEPELRKHGAETTLSGRHAEVVLHGEAGGWARERAHVQEVQPEGQLQHEAGPPETAGLPHTDSRPVPAQRVWRADQVEAECRPPVEDRLRRHPGP